MVLARLNEVVMKKLSNKSSNRNSEAIESPYEEDGIRQDTRLILRWRVKLRCFLDSEALIIVGCWSFWLLMGGIMIWLMSYCWYWGLVPSLS
jgi:hypothetical protein